MYRFCVFWGEESNVLSLLFVFHPLISNSMVWDVNVYISDFGVFFQPNNPIRQTLALRPFHLVWLFFPIFLTASDIVFVGQCPEKLFFFLSLVFNCTNKWHKLPGKLTYHSLLMSRICNLKINLQCQSWRGSSSKNTNT